MNVPKTVKTFGEYSKVKIGGKECSLLAYVQQLDIAFDVCQKGSHK